MQWRFHNFIFISIWSPDRKKIWCKLSDDTQSFCLLLLFKIALTTENNSLSHCIVLSVLQKSTFKKHAQSKDIFQSFFLFSQVCLQKCIHLYMFLRKCAELKGTYHMNILLHIMILYYILYTYKTKYTCLFLRPVNILAVLSVLLEGFSIMRFIHSSVKVL